MGVHTNLPDEESRVAETIRRRMDPDKVSSIVEVVLKSGFARFTENYSTEGGLSHHVVRPSN